MGKDILFENDANAKMIAGMNKVANAVKSTYGPKGRNVAFTQQYDVPLVTNDGYTIARQIILEDKFENLGAKLIEEASIKSNDMSGDGTTASVVIAQAIINEAYKNIAAGANPIFVKKGIDKAVSVVSEKLLELAEPVDSVETIKNIATISGNNDPFIGDLIGEIYEKLGFDPCVTLMDTQMAETNLIISNGSRLDSGYLSRYFLTDTVRGVCELDDPYIFICKDEIDDITSIVKLLEECVNNKASLAIIARDVKGTALSALAMNAEKNVLKVVALKGPGYGDTRDRNLECLAAVTGATVVDKTLYDIKDCGLDFCGRAKRIVVEKEVSTLEQPATPNSDHANELKKQIAKRLETETGVYEIDKLEQSLGLLNSAMGVIEVGGISELEMFERKYRIEDALNAAKRAALEGIVPGGGKALLLCKNAVEELLSTLSGDEAVGGQVILSALFAPVRQIAENAGAEPSVVVNNILSNKDKNFGYNALTGEYGDLFKLKVIDPVAVVKNSFINASSIASTYITAGAAVVDLDKKDERE